jgi:hypothetical protein
MLITMRIEGAAARPKPLRKRANVHQQLVRRELRSTRSTFQQIRFYGMNEVRQHHGTTRDFPFSGAQFRLIVLALQ